MTTYTDSLRLAIQAFNENNNTWGTVVGNQFTLLDKAIAGVAVLDVTGSVTIDMTASASDGSDSLSKRAVLKFTGLPTADCSVKVPAVSKVYLIHSSLTASKNIFIYPQGSLVGVTVGPSDSMLIYCDGTDMIKLVSNIDPSTVLLKSGNLASIANTSAALVNLGITASVAEINILDGVQSSMSATKVNYLNDVTSSIQSQFTVLTSAVNSVSAQLASVSAVLGARITSASPSVVATSSGGYVLNGLRFQWGFSSLATNPTISFPVAFGAAPYNVQTQSQTTTRMVNITSLSAGGFVGVTYSTETANSFPCAFYWSAVGPA